MKEFCKDGKSPVVRECPDCIDKFILLAGCYEVENAKLRVELEGLRAQIANLGTSHAEIAERLRVALLERDYFHADREKHGAEAELQMKHANEGWNLANERTRQWKAAELQVESSRKALEEIVCMQHMHEGAGGCHGGCPICCASVAIGLDKYLRNPGDKEKVETLSVKHGYTEKPFCEGHGVTHRMGECAEKQEKEPPHAIRCECPECKKRYA